MIVAIGADLARIARWEKHTDGLLRRSFTPAEIESCAGRAASLAGRWAAKESVLKALGVGIGDVPLTDIEIVRVGDGPPVVALHGTAASLAAQAGLTEWHVSISHEGDYAIAFVVATG